MKSHIITRAAIVVEARGWIGTPYRHQASCKGVGCDCLGLVRGVWRAAIGPEPEATPPYAADWAEASGKEALAEAALRHLVPVSPDRQLDPQNRHEQGGTPSPHRGEGGGEGVTGFLLRPGAPSPCPSPQRGEGTTRRHPLLPLGQSTRGCVNWQAEAGAAFGPGDVLLFRWRAGFVAKHAAIAVAPDRMVHAHDGAAVAEVAIAPWWRRRLAYAFRFPGVTD